MKSKPLTLKQAATIVIMVAGFCLLFAWWGHNALQSGDKVASLVYCTTASVLFLALPVYVRLYLKVKSGVSITVSRECRLASRQEVFRNFCIVIGFGTLTAIAGSYIIYTSLATIKTLTEVLLAVGTGGVLWLAVGFGWYWVLSNKPPSKFLNAQEQQDGVWPPPPIKAASVLTNEEKP